LQGYDYSQSGAYFITICTQNQECLFGHVLDGEMVLNDAGRLVAEEWMKSAGIRNEESLNSIREYIVNNPMKWDGDEMNPCRSG